MHSVPGPHGRLRAVLGRHGVPTGALVVPGVRPSRKLISREVERTCITYRVCMVHRERIRSPQDAERAPGSHPPAPGEGPDRIVMQVRLRGGSRPAASALAEFRKRTIGRKRRCPAEKNGGDDWRLDATSDRSAIQGRVTRLRIQ